MTLIDDGIAVREVVIGRNSKVWRAAAQNPQVASRFAIAISHADVGRFQFTSSDRVWVFAYSRVALDNSRLLASLEAARVSEVVYVSTATTIVTALTRCYEYPRIKQHAEDEARRRLNARILTLGLVVRDKAELPAGSSAVTFQQSIDDFLLAPAWPQGSGTRMRLFQMLTVPFGRKWERHLHRVYDRMQWTLRRWPCVLRPIDLVLKVVGLKWYGYVNLSNRLWATTTL